MYNVVGADAEKSPSKDSLSRILSVLEVDLFTDRFSVSGSVLRGFFYEPISSSIMNMFVCPSTFPLSCIFSFVCPSTSPLSSIYSFRLRTVSFDRTTVSAEPSL